MEDSEVQDILKKLGHSPLLDNETASARLERLRAVVRDLETLQGRELDAKVQDLVSDEEEEDKGGSMLLEARAEITAESLKRAAVRTGAQRALSGRFDSELLEAYKLSVQAQTRYEIRGSQIADDRLPAAASFSQDGSLMVTAGWSGSVSLWAMPQCSLIKQFTGHTDRVNSACIKDQVVLSGSADFSVRLWSESSSVVLSGHQHRVNKVLFHPSGHYCLSCSHDKTIRLWSLVNQTELLMQTGHSRGVYCMDTHPDGSLLVSGDLAGVGRIWDLRTGYTVMVLKGHIKQMLAVSAAANGYHIATGSDDCTIKIWDLRKHGLLYTIPAHTKLISGLHLTDVMLASSSYDNTAKLWSLTDFSLLQTFPHDNKVSDVTFGPKCLVTCSFDRTFKLWQTN
jgi:U4/U6 small nuclear ribonucleoprotein PRP4